STRRIDFDDPIPSKRPMHRIALEIMFQYMSAIYGMTTVNHDHLFASLLRLIPNRKIDEMDFRQKAFLAVTMHLNQMGVYPHEDLGKDKGVGMPYLIGNRSRRTGIVLVHGYMAAPPEIKKLAEYLGKRSFLVYAPRVSGHGTSPDDLAARTRKDWMESVDEGYAIVSCLCKQVVVGGFSTGAGLALDLAARVSGVKAVFAVSPPLQLQDL
ncbi:MAG TPA: alpha/beta fold hydrolase, partial [Deltaproteobacteria bacterium]|nr:alpha/beta fold hydrolase [Deltaproteobacteria bacterium]